MNMFDNHGQPLCPPEDLAQLVQYFGDQFHDPDFQPPVFTPIPVLQTLAVSEISMQSFPGQQLLAGNKSVAHAS